MGQLCCPTNKPLMTPETADERAVPWRHAHRDGVAGSGGNPSPHEEGPSVEEAQPLPTRVVGTTAEPRDPWWTDSRLSGPNMGTRAPAPLSTSPGGEGAR